MIAHNGIAVSGTKALRSMPVAVVKAIVLACMACLLCSCRTSDEIPAFDVPREDGPGYRMDRKAFEKFVCAVASSEPDMAESMIDRSVSAADSISTALGDPWTAEEFSHMLAGAFFDASSPYCSDIIYSMAIECERRSASLPLWHRRMLDFRAGILGLGAPGTAFPVDYPKGRPVIVFVRAEDCEACRKISEGLKGSREILSAVSGGLVSLETLYVSQDEAEGLWRLDPRYVPSLYLLDRDGVVLLKGCRDVEMLLESKAFENLFNFALQ
ncbi:MAG: thioredoxin family protein [Clostridium sp.]|nr:thioredoxin family protein [Bacteroides sp.]MCM1199042.1 thioredoxin family protein [Clostridium sp.]